MYLLERTAEMQSVSHLLLVHLFSEYLLWKTERRRESWGRHAVRDHEYTNAIGVQG